MKLTQSLLRQNIGWHFKQLWKQKSKIKILDTQANAILEEKGIPIFNPDDILYPQKPREKFDVVGYYPKAVPLDSTHPDWKSRVCLTYRDNNVLLEGLEQAKILTNTVEIKKGLPDDVQLQNTSKAINNSVKKIIYGSHVFDAEQVKLEKIKDPLRPAFTFPRVYGISERRRNVLMLSKLLNLIETHVDSDLVKKRYLFNDLTFSLPFERSGDLIQFQLTGNTLLTSDQPLTPVCADDTKTLDLPDLYPIKPTITLVPENIYRLKNQYPVNVNCSKCHPHTVFVHYHKQEVQNLYEEEVTHNQIFGRSLLKAFTVAASYAREKYGEEVKVLDKPVTVQCVQTDGRLFHFGIFQLNTLNLDDATVKNLWYQTEQIPLFESCMYQIGRPILAGYSDDVVKYLFAFYNNI